MNRIILPYKEVKPLINEADILLFQANGPISKLVGRSAEGKYSHCGLASWVTQPNTMDGILECVEFREGALIEGMFNRNAAGGGKSTNLTNVVDQYSGLIDIYRPVLYWSGYTFDAATRTTVYHRTKFEPHKVTETMRKMTGLPYGWKRIYWIFKHKMALLRLGYDLDKLVDDKLGELVYPVCSTSLAYCFNTHGFDLISNRADEWTEPSHIASSTRISYLFSLSA